MASALNVSSVDVSISNNIPTWYHLVGILHATWTIRLAVEGALATCKYECYKITITKSSYQLLSGALLSASGALLSASGALLSVSGALLSVSGALLLVSGALLSVSGALLPVSGALLSVSGALLSVSGALLTDLLAKK